MTTPTIEPAPLPGGRHRGRMRPVTSGVAGCVICAVALGALVTTHALPAGALASTITTADLLSIDHNTGTYFGGTGGVVVHRTSTGDVLDNLPDNVDVHAIVDAGRDALGNDIVYAAGDHGALYYQAGGNAWCRLTVPTAVYSENLRAIASAGPGDVEVAGTDGMVMELTGAPGCGATFIVDARVPGAPALNAIHHFVNGLVVAAGDAGEMLVGRFDSFVHHVVFSPVVTHTANALYGVVPSASGVVAVGAAGTVLDGSFSVDPRTLLPTLVTTVRTGIPTVASLRDAAAGYAGDPDSVPPAVLAAVGDGGAMIESLDGGVTWSAASSGSTAGLDGVYLGSTSAGVAVGATGTVVNLSLAQPTPTPSPTGTPGAGSTTSSTTSSGGSTTTTSGGGGTTTGSSGGGSSTTTTSGGGTTTGSSGGGSSSTTTTSGGGGTTTGSPGGGTTTSSSDGGSTTGSSGGGGSTSTTTVTNTVTSTDTATVEVTSVSTTTSTTTVSTGGGSGSDGGSTPPPPAPGTPAWAKRLVDELYLEVLSRTADPQGEAYWVDQVMGAGQGPAAIARSLLGSVEYRANLVRSVYWQYLGRGGEEAGVDSWVQAMGRGMTDENVRLAFLGSPEFWTNSGGNPQGYVQNLYRTVLQRTADASGQAYWVDRLDHGASPASVAASLIDSFEQMKQRAAGYYLTYLARSAGDEELTYWARALAHGVRDEDVILGFVGSTEFLSRI